MKKPYVLTTAIVLVMSLMCITFSGCDNIEAAFQEILNKQPAPSNVRKVAFRLSGEEIINSNDIQVEAIPCECETGQIITTALKKFDYDKAKQIFIYHVKVLRGRDNEYKPEGTINIDMDTPIIGERNYKVFNIKDDFSVEDTLAVNNYDQERILFSVTGGFNYFVVARETYSVYKLEAIAQNGITLLVNDLEKGENCNVYAKEGENATITARLEEGKTFLGWYDSLEGGNLLSSDLTYSCKLDKDCKVYAKIK